MSITREPITVHLSAQVLRFGDRSLPLRAITRATTAEIEPDRRAAVETYALGVAKWLMPTAVVSALVPQGVSALMNVAALVWFAISTARLARHVRLRLHELVVETTTGSHRVLVSTHAEAVTELAFRITDAIHDPALEFRVHGETIHWSNT
jgi:hypothetical protein